MLTLWYIILGWKEYNKPFVRVEQPEKPVDPAKKPDLIPLKKDLAPTKPTDTKNFEPPSSIGSKSTLPSALNNKTPESAKVPEIPKTPELTKMAPKTPEPIKMPPKTPEPSMFHNKPPEAPKMPDLPKLADSFKPAPKSPEVPKVTPKMPEPPKLPPRTSESPKVPDFKLAPETPKAPAGPKVPEDIPKTFPSRSPDSNLPTFPSSERNPAYVPPSSQAEFPIPPYLPGLPQNKAASRDDELFAMSSAFSNPSGPERPSGNLRDLSYAKGEFPGEVAEARVKEMMSRVPKYMEQSVVSNPDSLESDEEEDVGF